LNVTVIVPVRAVGTSAVVTLNDAVEPERDTLVGHVRPCPVHATVAVAADGSGAVSVTVTGTVDGEMVDVGFAATAAIVGGCSVSVAERACPPDVAVIVTVRVFGTTRVATWIAAVPPLRNTLAGIVTDVGSSVVSVMRILSLREALPFI